jgi:hypothetical protein
VIIKNSVYAKKDFMTNKTQSKIVFLVIINAPVVFPPLSAPHVKETTETLLQNVIAMKNIMMN